MNSTDCLNLDRATDSIGPTNVPLSIGGNGGGRPLHGLEVTCVSWSSGAVGGQYVTRAYLALRTAFATSAYFPTLSTRTISLGASSDLLSFLEFPLRCELRSFRRDSKLRPRLIDYQQASPLRRVHSRQHRESRPFRYRSGIDVQIAVTCAAISHGTGSICPAEPSGLHDAEACLTRRSKAPRAGLTR